MLDKVLDILQVAFDGYRLVRRPQLIHHERLGGILGFGGIHQLAFGIGVGDPLEYGLARFQHQVGEAVLVAEIGGGEAGRTAADYENVVDSVHEVPLFIT